MSTFVYGSNPNVPDYMVRSGTTYRILTDQVGSVRTVIDVNTGVTAWAATYTAFGVETVTTGAADFQPFGFAGGLYDPDTGLVRFGARDYDAVTGIWTIKDPILFGGLQSNIYTYVHNDPINNLDSSGTGPIELAGC